MLRHIDIVAGLVCTAQQLTTILVKCIGCITPSDTHFLPVGALASVVTFNKLILRRDLRL